MEGKPINPRKVILHLTTQQTALLLLGRLGVSVFVPVNCCSLWSRAWTGIFCLFGCTRELCLFGSISTCPDLKGNPDKCHCFGDTHTSGLSLVLSPCTWLDVKAPSAGWSQINRQHCACSPHYAMTLKVSFSYKGQCRFGVLMSQLPSRHASVGLHISCWQLAIVCLLFLVSFPKPKQNIETNSTKRGQNTFYFHKFCFMFVFLPVHETPLLSQADFYTRNDKHCPFGLENSSQYTDRLRVWFFLFVVVSNLSSSDWPLTPCVWSLPL